MEENAYVTEMQDLFSRVENELANNFEGKAVSRLGINDLERLKQNYEDLRQLSGDIQGRARADSSMTTDNVVLSTILNAGKSVDDDIAVRIAEADDFLAVRKSMEEAKTEERNRIATERNLIFQEVRNLRIAIRNMRDLAQRAETPLMKATYSTIVDDLESQLSPIEDVVKQYNDRIEELNREIEELRTGGLVEQVMITRNNTALLSAEDKKSFLKSDEMSRSPKAMEEGEALWKEPYLGTPGGEDTPDVEEEEIKDETPAVDMPTGEDGSKPAEEEKKDEPAIDTPAVDTGESTGEDGAATDEEEVKDEPDMATPAPETPATPGRTVREEKEKKPAPDLTGPTSGDPLPDPVVTESAPAPETPATPSGDIPIPPVDPAVVAEPAAPAPTPASKAPETLEEHIAAGTLPGNITEEKLIQICNAMGIPATDLKFKLNSEQLIRLRDDKEIQTAIMNKQIYTKQQKKLAEYDRLIAKYEALLNDKVTEEKFSPEYRAKIESLISQLRAERAVYDKETERFNTQTTVEHMADGMDPIDRGPGVTHRRTAKADQYNEELREEYKNLEKLRAEQKTMLSDRMKRRADRRVAETLKRIENLKAKRGKFMGKQQAVINEHSEAYIQKASERLQAHEAARMQVEENVEERLGYDSEIEERRKGIEALEHDRGALDPTKFRDRMTNIGLNRDRSKLQKDIARLQNKKGSCDRRLQQIRDYGATLSR